MKKDELKELHKVRAELAQEIKDMTPEQINEYLRKDIKRRKDSAKRKKAS